MKFGPQGGKQILRKLLYREATAELFERSKSGFAIPFGEWIKGPLRSWAEELLDELRLAAEGCFEAVTVRRRWHDHSGRCDSTAALWACSCSKRGSTNNAGLLAANAIRVSDRLRSPRRLRAPLPSRSKGGIGGTDNLLCAQKVLKCPVFAKNYICFVARVFTDLVGNRSGEVHWLKTCRVIARPGPERCLSRAIAHLGKGAYAS